MNAHRSQTALMDPHDGSFPSADVFWGSSLAMSRLREVAAQISRVPIPVFICGETGTGKETLATYIHRNSPWQDGPFIKINCAAIPGKLLESELFGFEAGAFTGARSPKRGLLELADSGTLLLDYISECDLALQAKLLRFLQDGSFTRIGSGEEVHVSSRVICLANVSLEQEVQCGRFREDLFHRIAGISLHMPLLKERLEDLPVIAGYLLNQIAATFGVEAPPLSRDLVRQLLRYSWPGNFRELENVLRRYVLLRTPEALLEGLRPSRHLSPVLQPKSAGGSSFKTRTRQIVKEAEALAILQALEEHGWHRANSARSLNISLRGLLYKMRSAGISSCALNRNPQTSIPPTASDGVLNES